MDFKKSISIYEQIGRSIQENILTSKWKEGERIPSVRDLATEIQVNPNTVMRSYTFLQEEGIIENKRGIGYFVMLGAKSKTMNKRKSEFAQEILPELFIHIDQLQISWDELKQYYHNWKNQPHEN